MTSTPQQKQIKFALHYFLTNPRGSHVDGGKVAVSTANQGDSSSLATISSRLITTNRPQHVPKRPQHTSDIAKLVDLDLQYVFLVPSKTITLIQHSIFSLECCACSYFGFI